MFTFPARIESVAESATEVIAALGQGFDGALVLAAIHEALVNAVVYGALRIAPPTLGRDLDDLFTRIRLAEAAHPHERVHALIVRSEGDRVVRISDPGPGFDWRAWLRSGRRVMTPSVSWSNIPTHGRGLVIMRAGSQSMWWNETGNEVSMRFCRSDDVQRLSRLDLSPNRRILVVSQDTVSRVGLRHAIQALGYDVRECEDPDDVPSSIDSWAPGVVLVHVPLAGERGLAPLLRRIASRNSRPAPAAVAFATSRVDPVVLTDALQSGAVDVLELPLWKADLDERLRAVIEASQG